MTAQRFRKRPVEFEAMQWDGTNEAEIVAWAGEKVPVTDRVWMLHRYPEDPAGSPWALVVESLYGPSLLAHVGDWIVKGPHGDFSVSHSEAFEQTYESMPAFHWA